ncbi:hypothetical protein C7M84_006162 [Penaeus vannamei]|uniref:Uncharacterized protein n=1 Tax=Penaeus vannamei TaxID=6689 RepID=A0A423UAT3_PENVA|nr:hypothetical protein C7M84_006162 [Penaeus vannamei]
MSVCRRHIHAWAVLVLSAATLALAAAAVASGSHRRSFERPLATHNTLVGIGSSPKRSAVHVAPTAPRTQEEQQQTTPPGILRRPVSAEEAEPETTGAAETPLLLASPRPSDDEAANSSRAESGAPTERASARGPRFIGKFKDCPHHHHQPIVQPIIIGTGHGHTNTITLSPSILVHKTHVAPSYMTAYVTKSHVHAYVTPSHVHIQEPHTVQPVILGIESHGSGSDWGWDMLGHGAHGHDDGGHVVYVMRPKPPAHEATGGAHIVIQEQEASPHIMDKGVQKIKDAFSGIYKIGEGIGSSVTSLFKREKADEAEVIVIEQPHVVTVTASKPVVTHTVMVQHATPQMPAHFDVPKRTVTLTHPYV